MAKHDIKQEESEMQQEAAKPTLVSFNVWFSELIMRKPQVKANHMSAIKAHFKTLGVSESEIPETFEAALKHYGI